jgi:hypothetical protein
LIDEKTPARPRFKVLMKGLAAPLAAADFGDPVAGGTSYAVCLYDQYGGTIGGFTLGQAGASCGVPARPCWRGLGTLGFRYVDRNGTEHGIKRVLLKGGATGSGKALVKARLVPGRSQSGFPPGMPLDLVHSNRATVQLVSSNGSCFSITTDQVLGADAGRFSARRR